MGAACLESNSAAAWYICKAARPSRLSVAAVGPGAGVVDDMVMRSGTDSQSSGQSAFVN